MTESIDLHFRGMPGVVATALLKVPGGVALVDPGPSSCLPALEAGLATRGLTLRDVRALLITHIHLDHAGATGSIVERVPKAEVYVHERGAPHLVDPARLLESAARLYGDALPALFGAFQPTPAANLHVLRGGERLSIGGRSLSVAYTPGHAKHHVSFLDDIDGVAYVGDTAGVLIGRDYVFAPTPPPDVDLEAWNGSLDLIEAWQPASLFLTHGQEVSPARAHIARVRDALATSADKARQFCQSDVSDAQKQNDFVEWFRGQARQVLSERDAGMAEVAAPFDQIWQGLARYWSKRQA